MSMLRVRTWHIAAVAILTTVIVASALAMAGAQASDTQRQAGVQLAAPYNEPIPAYANYKGWGYVAGGYGGYTGGARLVAPAPKVAYEWSGTKWIARDRYPGARVYIWPYASGWSWTWTQETGWYAMRTSDLQIGYRPIAIAT